MENTDIHQLPEVDALPDGFVDSSEPPAPQTPPLTKDDGSRSNGKEGNIAVVNEDFCEGVFTVESKEDTPNNEFHHRHSSTPKEKKSENSETKRKTKKSLLSEKEILELTLKYQCALNERDAAITVRDKLESLCRELQRQNKLLTEECKRISTEGKDLRMDLSSRFQEAIKDVGIKLEEQKEDCIAQMKENDMLRSKVKQFADQYAVLEEQFNEKLKQKKLELEVSELKNKQNEERIALEKTQIKTYADQISQLLGNEKSLRLQLASDGEKFQQFQEALVKSNQVFETFKTEMEKMGKSVKDLKKENAFLKSKCEKSDVTLIELVEEREMMKKQLEKFKNQKEKLESLCRSLQAERKQVCKDD